MGENGNDVVMASEDLGQSETNLEDNNHDHEESAKRQKLSLESTIGQVQPQDDPSPTWPEYLGQLISDKKVAASLPSYGFTSFHLLRLVNEAIEGAARMLPFEKELMGDLLTAELHLPDPDPEETEELVEEKIVAPDVPDAERNKINMVGRLLGPHGVVLLAMQGISGAKITVKGQNLYHKSQRFNASARGKNSEPEQELHVIVSAKDTPTRALARIDVVRHDLAKLWSLPKPGEDDEVKKRQLKLAKMIEGTYDPSQDDDDVEDEETLKQRYEKELGLPETMGDDKVTLTAKLPVPTEKSKEVNWVGRLLGPKGIRMKALKLKTGCRVTLKGKGIKDKTETSNEAPHIAITAVDEPMRATLRLQKCMEEAKKLFILPENPDDDPLIQMMGKGKSDEGEERKRKNSSRIPNLMQVSSLLNDSSLQTTYPHPAKPQRGARPHDVAGGPIRNMNNTAHRFNPMSAGVGSIMGLPSNPPMPLLGGAGGRIGSLMGGPMGGGHIGGGPMGGGLMGGGLMGGGPMGRRPMGGGPMGDEGEHKLFIYNIGSEAGEVDIYNLCSPFGAISKVQIQRDTYTGKAKGFCFVTFQDYNAAVEAIEGLNGHQYERNYYRKLQVKFYQPNEKK